MFLRHRSLLVLLQFCITLVLNTWVLYLRANLLSGVSKVMCLFCKMMAYLLSQRLPVTGTLFALASTLKWQLDTYSSIIIENIVI